MTGPKFLYKIRLQRQLFVTLKSYSFRREFFRKFSPNGTCGHCSASPRLGAPVVRGAGMPTDFASIFARESQAGAQISNDELAEPGSVIGAFSTLPLFRKMNEIGWHLLFGKFVAWLRNNHAEMIMALHQDELRLNAMIQIRHKLDKLERK